MSSFSIMTSPRLMPIRSTMVGWNAFSSGIEAPERCTESAQFTASTTLPNSTMAPSPISLTMRGAMKNTPLSIGNGSGLNTSAVTRGKCGPGQRLVLDADAVGACALPNRAPQGGSPHGPQLSRPFKRRYHQRRARRRRIALPPPTQVAEAFAVPNLDRNRWHISVQIQLKRTFFTDDYIKKDPRWSGASLSHYGSLCLIAHAALNVGATLEEMHGRIFLSRVCLARFLLLDHLGCPLSSSICGKAESRNQKRR